MNNSGPWSGTPNNARGSSHHSLVPLITLSACLVLVTSVLLTALMVPQTGLSIAPPLTGPHIIGTLTFGSSGQLNPQSSTGINDIIHLQLYGVLPPSPGMRYDAWLLPDSASSEQPPVLLGSLTVYGRNGQLTYSEPKHTNLLAVYSQVLIAEQPGPSAPLLPPITRTDWRYAGHLPAIPTPGDPQHYSFLAHVRHLLASDPTLQSIGLSGGLAIWLYRNVGKILEWANAARDDWAQHSSAAAALLRRQVDRILDYLDGTPYVNSDVPMGTPFLVDPQAGRIGLLQRHAEQDPPSYLTHIAIHLRGLIAAPGATVQQQQEAARIDTALDAIDAELTEVRQDAIALAHLSDGDLQQPAALALLNEMVAQATVAYVGQETPLAGSSSTSARGVSWITGQLQQFATIAIAAVGG